VSRSWWVVEIDDSPGERRWAARRYHNPNATGFVPDPTDDSTAHRLTARLNERATPPPDPPPT
jgi:hypothetical protein